MAKSAPTSTDTVIVGNGPSALILSYILHGNIPAYTASPPHPDALLHAKLVNRPDLLRLDVDHVTNHFEASDFSYSSQGLPINVLLDALVRPEGDTGELQGASNLSWEYRPERAIPHLVIGNTASPGGQWVENPVHASWSIGTLSYAAMLSLPGYSFAEHWFRTTGKVLSPFTRPSRSQVTEYFQHYPRKARTDDTIWCQQTISGVVRTQHGFYIKSHDLTCKHLVLASGIFSELTPAPPLLQPLLHVPGPSHLRCDTELPLLVVGSGFSAADFINSCPPEQRIIHIYHWKPSTSPSPLRACHQQAYPDYAGVYRRMKEAARKVTDTVVQSPGRPKGPRRSKNAFDLSRDWKSKYEGLPNATITDVKVESEAAQITLRLADGETIQRRISGFEYLVGRRGSLNYLSKDLRREIHPDLVSSETVSGSTLRGKVLDDIEVGRDVFAIGSLTGDTLIRFALGSATYAAGKIMAHGPPPPPTPPSAASPDQQAASNSCTRVEGPSRGRAMEVMNGLDGHHDHPRRHDDEVDNEIDDEIADDHD